MKVTLDIADADIVIALQTAAEPGIGYWGADIGISGEPFYKVLNALTVTDHHGYPNDPDKHTVHRLDIERGLRMMYQNPLALRAIGKGYTPSEWDANQADAFVQYAAFGELRYG